MKAYSSISFVYTLSLINFLSHKTNGEHVLPEHSNLIEYEKFYQVATYEGIDACGIEFYSYDILASTAAICENVVPVYGDCVWDCMNFDIVSENYAMPYGFLTTNPDDWAKIITGPWETTALPGTFRAHCYGGNGIDRTYDITAYPFYDCPQNTRLSYDNVTFEIGCTTTPTPCVADIVGRDLGSDGGEFFGHVGLVTALGQANPNILEVLNGTNTEPTKIGIFLDPLYGENAFVTQTKYWGSRYEPQNFARLPLTLASQVIQAGIDQQQYLFNYTIGWLYYPGGTEEYPNSCEFRCDSFVYYCYEKGAQIKLQPYFEYPLTVPLSMFTYDFSCSADPVEYCSAYENTKELALLPTNKIDEYKLKLISNTMQKRTMTGSLKIFQLLRPALATKSAQKKQLPWLIEKYQGHQRLNISELFMRCLCFELEKMNPSQLDQNIRPLLSNLLWQHRYLSNDNFLLALMENTLSFYLENPHCDWLSAFFTVKAETQTEKETGMIAYIDQQENVTEKANLIVASKISSSAILTDEKRNSYGSLFQQAYTDKFLSEREIKVIWLSLSEMKTPTTKTCAQAQFFENLNNQTHHHLRTRNYP